MSDAKRFFDTNVLLYLLSGDVVRADRAEAVLEAGGILSVQVLNEFASVASRKLEMSMADIREVLGTVRAVCEIKPLTEETHDRGLELAERYGLSIYDSMIVAAALLAGCETVLSEDMQDGQIIEGIKIHNPFC